MESTANNTPLVVIVGETASGKSALAMKLAELFNGEIIAADSRTVYKSLDIGTAKPTETDRHRIGHHLLDVVDPDQTFTAADFKRLALHAIDDITARGKLPILVGGSGLYIDAVLYDFSFAPVVDPLVRQELQALSIAELQERIKKHKYEMPENDQNPRHLMRTIERAGAPVVKNDLRPNTLVLGVRIDRDELRKKITHRVDITIERGLAAEVEQVSKKYGWDAPGLQAPAYKAFREYIDGSISLDQAKAKNVQNDLYLAKRQRTWFRRNNSIHWISKQTDAVDLVTTFLNK